MLKYPLGFALVCVRMYVYARMCSHACTCDREQSIYYTREITIERSVIPNDAAASTITIGGRTCPGDDVLPRKMFTSVARPYNFVTLMSAQQMINGL